MTGDGMVIVDGLLGCQQNPMERANQQSRCLQDVGSDRHNVPASRLQPSFHPSCNASDRLKSLSLIRFRSSIILLYTTEIENKDSILKAPLWHRQFLRILPCINQLSPPFLIHIGVKQELERTFRITGYCRSTD